MQECTEIAEIRIHVGTPLRDKLLNFLKSEDVIVRHIVSNDIFDLFTTYQILATPDSNNCVYYSGDGFSKEVHENKGVKG